MARFMNKRELVLIVLLILVFDLNGFCDLVTSTVPYKKKFNYLVYLLTIVFLLFDLYVFNYIVTKEPESMVVFKVDHDNISTNTDEIKTETITSAAEEKIVQDENMFSLVEKVVVNFVALVITFVVIITIYFAAHSGSPDVASVKRVTLLLTPLILVVLSLLSFGNIYLNM